MAGSTKPTRTDILRALCGGIPGPPAVEEAEEPGPVAFGEGLSRYWRKNTSPLEAVDLANLLRALRKVAGHLGPNAGRIEYTGMSRGDEAAIVVEPRLVMGRYPVPPDKVDYLVGWVTHEGLRRTEWSERVWKILAPAFLAERALARIVFQKIVHVGEEIYLDQVADQGVFGLYTPQVRAHALETAKRRLRPDVLSVDALVYWWWSSVWGTDGGRQPDPAYQAPLARLRRLTADFEQVRALAGGVLARCQRRADLYGETWESLREPLSTWKVLDRRAHGYSSTQTPEDQASESRVRQHARASGLPDPVARQVALELAHHSADITPIIQNIVGYDDSSVVSTSRWDFHIPAHPVVDRRLVSRLRATFRSYSPRVTLKSRGLTSGRVDKRRLYRAPVNGRAFLQADRLPNPEWNVTLLIDASGSMKGKKWRLVESAVAALHQALRGSGNHLEACAYFEIDGVCMVSRLIKGRQLLSVPPCGQTASGQAIIAAAYFMPRDRKRNLLIHVTDGESNFGCEVRHGIDYCRRQGIHLVTLGCGCRDRQAMVLQYGKSLQFLNHFGQLSQAIEHLLKWTFLYGARPQLGGFPKPAPQRGKSGPAAR